MTVNYSAYNDIISIYFIAGCGPTSALSHTKGCHGRAKTQASPMSAASLGLIIIWGKMSIHKHDGQDLPHLPCVKPRTGSAEEICPT